MSVPDQREQDDDRDRNAEHPKKNSATHERSPYIVSVCECDGVGETLWWRHGSRCNAIGMNGIARLEQGCPGEMGYVGDCLTSPEITLA